MISDNITIYSFYNIGLDTNIPILQKKIFNKFGLNIIQVCWEKDCKKINNHGDGLNYILKNCITDYLICFDIDCFPLNSSFYKEVYNQIEDKKTLVGAIGCANHINKNKLYVHPSFFACSKSLYYECGCPDMNEFEYGDVACRFTDECINKNKNIIFWNVTDSGDSIWNITSINQKFGHGTVFENCIYHQFEIRDSNQHLNFIKKANEILSN